MGVRQRRRSYSNAALALVSFILVASSPLPAHGEPVGHQAAICTRAYRVDSASVGGVLFESFEKEVDAQCVRASRNGHVLFQQANDGFGSYTLGQRAWHHGLGEAIPAIPNGADLTGRGRPDMLVSAWSGGAHCCRTDYVFELRPKFRLVGVIDARDADLSHFAQLDAAGRYFYISADYVFAYWHGSFAGSPVERVVLEYRDDSKRGGFHLALDKMQQPAPSKEEWDKALEKVKNDIALKRKGMVTDLRTDLWSEVMHLLYTGHSELAWKFLEAAGPEAQADPDPDLADFCGTLKASDYWRDLEPTIQDMPEACKGAKADGDRVRWR